MFPECKISEADLGRYWPTVTPAMVRESLNREKLTFTDFLNLISPAGAGLMDELRNRAAEAKRTHFGQTVRLYSPLYISSYCKNNCVYCAFKSSHRATRRRLTLEEILREAAIIKGYGIDSLLLVSGEDNRISADFLAEAVRELKKMFSYISIEIYPMEKDDYRKLFEAGVHGLTVYQETYQEDLYKKLHPSGPKSDYRRRLRAPDDGAAAGFYNVGLGFLLGLYDWRTEAVSLAANGLWLRKKHWRTKIQFSFPRITPIPGGYDAPSPVSQDELEQLMLAFRIFFQEADMFISTREKREFRMHMAPICVSHISGGSQVVPGGYAEAEQRKEKDDLGQFTVNDASSVASVCKDLKAIGLEPVFKDWDCCIGA